VPGLDGDVRSGADGDPDVGGGQGGASFTPSPTMATFFPCAWSSRTLDALSSGSTSAKTVSMPSSSATASATACASPVSIATSIPRSCSARMASRLSSRIASATAKTASALPSRSR
jgi:hypothetical protein